MAGYLGSTPVPQATQHRESFTATEGQTSFATAGYTPQFLDVFLNGSHLSPADFVATNSSDVVLVVAASADDICDIVSYTPFEVADATFTGTTTTDVSLTTGVLTANGGAVFNEGSADVDFRVESNINTNALFVDGATGNVGIGRLPNVINASGSGVLTVRNNGANRATIETQMETATASGIYSQQAFYNGDTLATLFQHGGDGATDSGYLKIFTKATGASATEKLRIHSSGVVTTPLQPAFNAYLNASTGATALSANGTHKVAFAHEFFDQASNFNPGSGNHNFTCPAGGAGVYHFSTGVLLLGIGTGTSNCEISIKHESHHAYYGSRVDGSTGWGDSYVSLAADTHLYLDEDDVVAVYVYATEAFGIYGHSSGSSTYFTGVKVA